MKRRNYQRGMKMKDADKTKDQIIHELVELRKQLAELKDSESKSAMELSKSEERYRQLVENTLVGVWQADTQARFVFINKRLADHGWRNVCRSARGLISSQMWWKQR